MIGKCNIYMYKNCLLKIVLFKNCLLHYSCLHYFHLEEKLQSHEVECKKLNDCAIYLPEEDEKWLEFVNYKSKEYVPFVIYSDLECVLRKMKPGTENTSSFSYQHHEVQA